METKTLFVLIGDQDDGSYSPYYTFNKDWIAAQEEAYENDELEHNAIGVDGDGFHYDTLTVPADCTLESLGVTDCARD